MQTSGSLLRRRERVFLHSLLVLEQLLGRKRFDFFFGHLKQYALGRLEKRLEGLASPPPVNVERRQAISAEEFQREYFRKGRPVIFSGAARDWGCVKNWSLDFFASRYGEKELLLVDAEGLTSKTKKSGGYEFLKVKELVSDIRSENNKYLRFSPLIQDNPGLTADFDLSWFHRMRGARTFANTYYMFMGGAGQRTHLHNDQPCNLFVQVKGEKRWTLYPVADSVFLYPRPENTAYVQSEVNLSAQEPDRHPLFRFARAHIAHLQEGDILYCPPFMWHEVENLSETIAFGYRFSSLRAALKGSVCFAILRVLCTNPPLWKTMSYGKIDTNLIWAHTGGAIKDVLQERKRRSAEGK